MKIFIFEDVEKLTANYHSGGALVVIAETLEAAIKHATSKKIETWGDDGKFITLTDDEIKAVKVFELAGTPDEQMFIFRDAGCC